MMFVLSRGAVQGDLRQSARRSILWGRVIPARSGFQECLFSRVEKLASNRDRLSNPKGEEVPAGEKFHVEYLAVIKYGCNSQ